MQAWAVGTARCAVRTLKIGKFLFRGGRRLFYNFHIFNNESCTPFKVTYH
jgi:hypothetical protein